jgi:hypothetical protein
MIHSYPSIYNLGHAAIADLLKGPVIVEEKLTVRNSPWALTLTDTLNAAVKAPK